MATSGIKRSGRDLRSRLAALRAAMLPLALLMSVGLAQAADEPNCEPTCSPVTAALEKEPGDWVAVDRLPASKAALVLGDGYTIEIRRGEAVQRCRGPLIHLTDDWVVLRQAVMSSTIVGIPYLMDIPGIGELFYHQTDIVALENDVWIPRSTATIESHLQVTQHAAEMPHLPDAPPLKATCYVLVAVGGTIESFSGVLTAVGENEVTMLRRDDGRALRTVCQNFLSVAIEGTGPQPADEAEPGADEREAKPGDDSKPAE